MMARMFIKVMTLYVYCLSQNFEPRSPLDETGSAHVKSPVEPHVVLRQV